MARAITADIASGVLAAGQKLPPHRTLAHMLGVTPGTISRAYNDLAKRGLLSGEVGRGTFIANPSTRSSSVLVATDTTVQTEGRPALIDLAVNRQPSSLVQEALSDVFRELAEDPHAWSLMTYQPDGGTHFHREAFASWVRKFRVSAEPDRVVLTAGALHGAYVVLKAFTKPGDSILVEEFTYAGFKALATELQLRLEPVAIDSNGLIANALAERARASASKWLFCMPGLHNPTAATMPAQRRKAVLEIADRHDLMVIEDGVYDFLQERTIDPLQAGGGERVFYVTGLSKSVAPGLRAGCVVAPARYAERLAGVIRRSMWMVPPLGLQISAQWMRSGKIDHLISAQLAEFKQRRTIAEKALAGFSFSAPISAAFLWLRLPEGANSRDLVAAAEDRGVRIAPTDAFATKRAHAEGFLRVSLSSCRSVDELSKALAIVAEIAAESCSGGTKYY